MSYQLYDVKGYLGDFATADGLKQLREAIYSKGENAAFEFLELGASLITDELEENLKDLIKKIKEPSVKETLKNLIKLMNGAELAIIINDGLNDNLTED